MRKRLIRWQLFGFAVTSLAGTLLHFLYDWLGQSPWIAPFSGVNESTWEHMKLLFWPMLGFAAVQRLFFSDTPGFWCVQCRGILTGLVLIPVLFYTYNGAVGPSPDLLNIAIFFVAAAVAYWVEFRQLQNMSSPCRYDKQACLALCTLACLFVLCTFFPPKLLLFQDPVTGSYGI